jgi:hypothetical protein
MVNEPAPYSALARRIGSSRDPDQKLSGEAETECDNEQQAESRQHLRWIAPGLKDRRVRSADVTFAGRPTENVSHKANSKILSAHIVRREWVSVRQRIARRGVSAS